METRHAFLQSVSTEQLRAMVKLVMEEWGRRESPRPRSSASVAAEHASYQWFCLLSRVLMQSTTAPAPARALLQSTLGRTPTRFWIQ